MAPENADWGELKGPGADGAVRWHEGGARRASQLRLQAAPLGVSGREFLAWRRNESERSP